ncbi:MAG: RNA polymerase sigma factor [Candidatus Poribacteria bacterium]|nr:RNA polymerase sigma factor [Candidatus Poribacteria bacterium]
MRNDNIELIQRILEGDDAAFACLVRKYQKRVHALAWRKIGDFHIAEDITQETFLQVYRKLATLKNPSQFPGWLYVITNRCCLAWLRKKRIQTQSVEEIDMAIADGTSYSSYVATKQAESAAETKRELVKNLLAKLKESDRTVVTLYYFGEMTYEEIGAFLGMSADTVRMRVRRALQRLKKHEPMIREALSSFQLSPNLTENIMREIPRIKPLSPTGGNPPVVPWAIATSTLILVVMMLGISNQYLARFQRPYSFDATSEMTVELIDVPIVLDLTSKPDVRNQFGNIDSSNKRSSTGMKLNDILESHFNAIGGLARLSEIRNVRRSGDAQLTQWNGQPVNESGRVEIAAVVGKKSYNQQDFGELFSETSVWNDEGGWKSVMGNSPTILPETEYGRAKSTTYIDPLQAIYEELGSSVFQQIEDELFRGKECSVIRVIDTEDVFYIDKASNLLVGAKTTYTDLNVKNAIAVLHYADYTDYEGVMLPNSYEISIGDGALTVNYTITKTEIDSTLDETIFEKP